MKVSEVLTGATEILQDGGVAEPHREASSLLAFALLRDRTFLIAHPEYELDPEEKKRFGEFLNRRANREPFQYITGTQEFYGLNFKVTPDVLIPRPETELLVENAIELLRSVEKPSICEVGIGSGCILVSILHAVEPASGIGLDVSEEVLQVSKENAETHNVLERLELRLSDVFEALQNERFDLIISNPPYVPDGDFSSLQAEVRDFEPKVALTGGDSGLSIIDRIIRESPKFLKPKGFLLMEIGFNQGERVRPLFDKRIWKDLEILPDLQGIPRMVKARIRV